MAGWLAILRGKTQITLPTETGAVTLTRGADDWVEASVSNWRPQSTGTVLIGEIPAGYRPARRARGLADENVPSAVRALVAYPYAPFRLEVAGIVTAGTYVTGSAGWYTNDPRSV